MSKNPKREQTSPERANNQQPSSEEKGEGGEHRHLEFHYLKNSNYRTIRIDGAMGGVLPTGNISVTFWSERLPIPRVVVHEVTTEGTLGDPIPEKQEGKQGVIREIEVATVLDPIVALQISQWLKEKAEDAIRRLSDGQENTAPKEDRDEG